LDSESQRKKDNSFANKKINVGEKKKKTLAIARHNKVRSDQLKAPKRGGHTVAIDHREIE